MPIILGTRKELEGKILSVTGSGSITLAEFKEWKAKLLSWNTQMHIPNVVDLSREIEMIFFKKQTLLDLIDSPNKPNYLVFHFVCSGQDNKFRNVRINVCGVNKPYYILTRVFQNHTPPGNDKPLGKDQPDDINILNSGVNNVRLRNREIVTRKPDLGFPSDEFQGYAHESEIISNWLRSDDRIINVAVVFGVDIRAIHRTVVMLVGATDRYKLLLPLSLADDLIIDNGTQCCPIQ